MFLFLIIPPQWESMPAIWTVHKKVMKFGTLIGVVLNTNLTKLCVSDTNSVAPPPFQIFTFLLIITFQPFTLEIKLFTFCLLYYSSTVSHNQCLTLRLHLLQSLRLHLLQYSSFWNVLYSIFFSLLLFPICITFTEIGSNGSLSFVLIIFFFKALSPISTNFARDHSQHVMKGGGLNPCDINAVVVLQQNVQWGY